MATLSDGQARFAIGPPCRSTRSQRACPGRLRAFAGDDPPDRQGFRDILVTQRDNIPPYVSNWWPPGHGLGYEHTFVHAVADFVNACADGKSVQPTFEDGLKNQRGLTAVEESSAKGKWVKV